MADIKKTAENLMAMGYTVQIFDTKEQAADYIDSAVDGVSVGIGGSQTVQVMGLYDRLAAHNEGRGAKYTKYRTPCTMVYSEELEDKSAALRREAAIKKRSRAQKLALIDGKEKVMPPTQHD